MGFKFLTTKFVESFVKHHQSRPGLANDFSTVIRDDLDNWIFNMRGKPIVSQALDVVILMILWMAMIHPITMVNPLVVWLHVLQYRSKNGNLIDLFAFSTRLSSFRKNSTKGTFHWNTLLDHRKVEWQCCLDHISQEIRR